MSDKLRRIAEQRHPAWQLETHQSVAVLQREEQRVPLHHAVKMRGVEQFPVEIRSQEA